MTALPDPSASADTSDLIACASCDAVYRVARPDYGERTVCERCHSVLISPRRAAGLKIIAVALAAVILIFAAALFPFMSIDVAGARNAVSLLDAALAFQGGPLVFVSLVTVALILFIPLARMLLVLYVIAPLVAGRAPARGARTAFRWAEDLRPWSMAEIFAIGCAVSLIKISDLANVSLGPAFWMFAVLVVLVVVQDTFMCRWSVWNALDKAPRS